MKTQFNNKPIKSLRDGSLKAVIWENQREGKIYRTVDLYRTYKDKGDSQLKDISNYSGAELLRISRLANKAYDTLIYYRELDKQTQQLEGAE